MALRATTLFGRFLNQTSVSKTFISKQIAPQNANRSRTLITMPALDYDFRRGIQPGFSGRAMSIHYQGILGGQVIKLNKLISGTPLENASLEEIIRETNGDAGQAAIYNNASEIWNHTFFFKGLTTIPNKPDADLAEAIDTHFGSFAEFQAQFTRYAKSLFGNGWVWLVNNDGQLEIIASYAAFNPLLKNGVIPLLALDMWEHSYWADYDNQVTDYVNNYFKIVNWAEVKKNHLTAEYLRRQAAEAEEKDKLI